MFVVLKEGHLQNEFLRGEVKTENIQRLELQHEFQPDWTNSAFAELVYLFDVSLQYGDRKILDRIDWQINSGERWSLSGLNGSGKTSLLNLIFGDNPKAYGCNIRLFGKQKGTGESI